MLNILNSTKSVLENARFVSLDTSKIDDLAKRIDDKIKEGLESADEHFGRAGNLKDDIQLVFVEDVVNFCFWAEKNKEKWKVEWKGRKTDGGWYSLKTCFERAINSKIPILNPEYIASIRRKEAAEIFKGLNGVEIPLLDERVNNLREAGRVLLEKYQGHFINVVEESDYDAVKLVELISKDFPSFRDIAELDGQNVFFLKRAQICAHDLSYAITGSGKEIKNIDKLTACADYKLPQILRMFGLIKYNDELVEKIDNYVLIPSGSREEIEIRAATIWGIELIRQRLNEYSAIKIDFALWLMSQETSEQVKPYHRTYTIFY